MTIHTRRNHLYTLRRIRGLPQKQLAYLLGYSSAAMISRFEHGSSLPPLSVVFILEMVLGTRAEEIWVDMHQHLRNVLLKRVERLPDAVRRQVRGRLLRKDDT